LLNGKWNWWPEKYISLRIQGQNLSETIKYTKSAWDRFNTGKPLEYTFLDDNYASLYDNEQRTGMLFSVFSVLAVFITSFGLFGLISFITQSRKKEVGIRKTLGAGNLNIALLFNRDFIKLVIFANLIAWPVAYIFMNKWLQNFAYHINLTITSFVMSGILVLLVSLITISYQTFKAARANPIDSLRYE